MTPSEARAIVARAIVRGEIGIRLNTSEARQLVEHAIDRGEITPPVAPMRVADWARFRSQEASRLHRQKRKASSGASKWKHEAKIPQKDLARICMARLRAERRGEEWHGLPRLRKAGK